MARENLQQIIAQNITLLRRANGMTQAGLAEKLLLLEGKDLSDGGPIERPEKH